MVIFQFAMLNNQMVLLRVYYLEYTYPCPLQIKHVVMVNHYFSSQTWAKPIFFIRSFNPCSIALQQATRG